MSSETRGSAHTPEPESWPSSSRPGSAAGSGMAGTGAARNRVSSEARAAARRLEPAPRPGSSAGSAASGVSGVNDLEGTFRAYCGGKQDMDGKTFAKMCKDCRLIDGRFTATDADLIFSKAVEKGQRRIGWSAFQRALEMVAQRK